MNTYMKPFVDECIELYSNGLTWQSDSGEVVTSTGYYHGGRFSCLATATEQFNGEMGYLFVRRKELVC